MDSQRTTQTLQSQKGFVLSHTIPLESRDLVQITQGTMASDGDGVRLMRFIGGPELPMLDPFMLLDCFGSDQAADYIGGFPDHPHRGFETVTYMLAGRMRHKDSTGHEDVIGPGDVQWMTAGRGLVHSEMPEQTEGRMEGFQLWVNLPAAEKMSAPTYRALPAALIPCEPLDGGGTIKVVAGVTDHGTSGPIEITPTQPIFFDVQLAEDGAFTQRMPAGHQGFIYVIEGSVRVGPKNVEVTAGSLGVFGPGDQVVVATDASVARFLLVAGRAIGEPVARYGPFVMNTRDEIVQAIHDFQNGHF
jgi:redox-sensitive bicupin YhaK (pirin superfamily)